MRSFRELSEEEQYVLCALYRIVGHKIGKKPHHAPIGEIMKKLVPSLRDSTIIKKSLKSLKKKELIRKVKTGGEKTSWTLTKEGAHLASRGCPVLWEG